jgi:hypothetical protein
MKLGKPVRTCDKEDRGRGRGRGPDEKYGVLWLVWFGRYLKTYIGRDCYIKTLTELEMEGSRIWLPYFIAN